MVVEAGLRPRTPLATECAWNLELKGTLVISEGVESTPLRLWVENEYGRDVDMCEGVCVCVKQHISERM